MNAKSICWVKVYIIPGWNILSTFASHKLSINNVKILKSELYSRKAVYDFMIIFRVYGLRHFSLYSSNHLGAWLSLLIFIYESE